MGWVWTLCTGFESPDSTFKQGTMKCHEHFAMLSTERGRRGPSAGAAGAVKAQSQCPGFSLDSLEPPDI